MHPYSLCTGAPTHATGALYIRFELVLPLTLSQLTSYTDDCEVIQICLQTVVDKSTEIQKHKEKQESVGIKKRMKKNHYCEDH